jgi:signal transduction histidine kinase
MQSIPAESLFEYLRTMFLPNEGMEFDFTCEQAVVTADPSLIQTVLVNLIDNACKASEPGSRIEIEGRIAADKFAGEQAEEENNEPESRWYRFSVRDYGIGIPEEELSKITQAFYMVDKSRSRSRNGVGLGLALCTEILSLHGSRLEIESVPGQGTKVGFLLREAGKEAQHEEIDS